MQLAAGAMMYCSHISVLANFTLCNDDQWLPAECEKMSINNQTYVPTRYFRERASENLGYLPIKNSDDRAKCEHIVRV
jgi:hypothetical protein